jgi:uncharacterized membrane protein
MMVDVTNKFGDWIKEGFEIYKNNLGVLILSSLIAFVLTGLTLGILGGPMFAGLIGIVLKIRDRQQPTPTVGDVFQGFQNFLPSFLFVIVWGLTILVGTLILSFIPCLGQLLSICLAFAASTFLMFGLFLIVEKKMDFWPASMASIDKVKPTFFPYLGLAVVAGIIGNIGSLACGIGAFATMPLYFTIISVVYRDVFSNGQTPQAPPIQEIKPPQPEPPQAPPAPEKPNEGA